MSNNKIKLWLMAMRPSSLMITLVPVIMGTAMAYGDGLGNWQAAFMALFGAAMIHIGTNLANDYCDLAKGADRKGDMDPMRGSAVGSVPPVVIKISAIVAFVLALPACVYLIQRAGRPVIIIAVASILAGIFYTAGKRPLGYRGLGDMLVLLFFGPVAVAGTYYVQSLEMNLAVIVAGLAPGLMAVGVLTINNIRDYEKDTAVQKLTLAVRFGRSFAVKEYFFAVIGASLVPVAVYAITRDYIYSLAAVATIFFAFPPLSTVMRTHEASALNSAIGATIRLLLIYGALFSVGWIMSIG